LCKLTPQEKLKAMVKQVAKESGVLGKLAARKAAKSGKAPATTAAATTTTTVEESKATETVETKGETVAVENEATDAKVNPPENADAPVVTVETIEAEKAAKVAEKAAKTSKGKKQDVVSTPAVAASSQ